MSSAQVYTALLLCYYTRGTQGGPSFEKPRKGDFSPIEVKSSTNYTLTSIKKCIEKYRNYLSTPYVLHSKDVEIKEELVFLPLYMTPLL